MDFRPTDNIKRHLIQQLIQSITIKSNHQQSDIVRPSSTVNSAHQAHPNESSATLMRLLGNPEAFSLSHKTFDSGD